MQICLMNNIVIKSTSGRNIIPLWCFLFVLIFMDFFNGFFKMYLLPLLTDNRKEENYGRYYTTILF